MFTSHDYIKIPRGKYLIGISQNILNSVSQLLSGTDLKREYFENSCPLQEIFLDNIAIAKKPVTCRDFRKFVKETGYVTEAEKEKWGWVWEKRWMKKSGVSWEKPFADKKDRLYREMETIHPVIQVSWNDAEMYCRWLSSKCGEKIRLPRETEWEVFASLTGCPGIENIIKTEKNFIKEYHPEHFSNELKRYGIIKPGIIWEWTIDWFEQYPGGIPNKEYGKTYKILRGGSFLSHDLQRLREYRFRRCPTARSPYYGFRIAVELE